MPPQNLIQLQNAAKSFGSKALFERATFSINEGEHVGVIGPNGAGKTTLFRLLTHELELDHGELISSRSLKLGYLQQHEAFRPHQTLEEFLTEGTITPIWELKKLGADLGLHEDFFSKPIASLSGGYRMRAKLLHLLGEQPNLMLLDEPTNYLDLETLIVLEEFLQTFEGAFLLISHDREFLRRTTDHILEIERGDFVKYAGNIDDYFEQKELLRTQLEKRALTQEAKRKEILDFAARFGAKATKARQAQSRLKQLDRMEKIELKSLPVGAKIRIPPPPKTGRVALEMNDVDLGYEDKVILQKVHLQISSGDHLAVVGVNGAGKSTLLKTLAGEIPLLFGDLTWGYQVKTSYYAQHVAEKLIPQETVHEALKRAAHPDVRDQDILDLAGGLLFAGDNIKKKVSVLSGGEKARVALGQILLQKSPVLILDEPTNHLDFYTVEALTQALEKYEGTIIFVSHDRGFVRRIGTRILEISNGRAHFYPGTYDDYVWSVQQRHARGDIPEAPQPLVRRIPDRKADEAKTSGSTPTTVARPSVDRERKKALESERRTIDRQIQDLDRKIKTLESRLNEQGQKLEGLSNAEMAQAARELSATQKKIQDLEAEMLSAIENRERILNEIG